MEAYDSTEQAADMVDSTWASGGVPAAYRASRWSGLFGPEDFRSTLSWRGRFAGIANAVNCYSETEDVVGNPRQALTVFGETSWVMQEYLKGDSRLHAINLIPGSHISCEGGWGRSAHYPLWLTLGSMLGLSDLTREDVIENPLFTPFRNETERMSSTNLFSIVDTAATSELPERLLLRFAAEKAKELGLFLLVHRPAGAAGKRQQRRAVGDDAAAHVRGNRLISFLVHHSNLIVQNTHATVRRPCYRPLHL